MLTDAIVHHINLLTRLELIMSKKIKSKIKLVNCVVSDIDSDVPHIICDFVYRGARVSRLFELDSIITEANESVRDGHKYYEFEKEYHERSFGKAKTLYRYVEDK
tara:strand:- start:17 stop:331 length:315 start_codon:yes stop_codon:yes gene_type:complete